jgi:PAS domain S-box-containing protein
MNTQSGHTHSLPRNGPVGGPGTDAGAPLGLHPVAGAVVYGVFGLAWIAVSGLLRSGFGAAAGQAFDAASALAFVAASALLIYGLLRRTQSTLARRNLRRWLVAALVRGYRKMPQGTTTDIWEDEQLPRLYFDLPFVGMAISSAATRRLLRVNDEFCRMLGYPREVLETRTWADLTHPDDLNANAEKFAAMLAGRIEGYRLRKRYVRADGSPLHAELEVRCVRAPDGTAKYTLATVNDITERRLAELRLTRARDLNAMLSRVNAAVAHADDEMRLLSDTCRIAVESGYFAYARAAYAPGGDGATDPSIVEYPPAEGLPPCGSAPPAGDDPCVSAISSGNRIEWSDVSHMAAPGPCARDALARGVRSVASEPLRRGDTVVGSLCLFAGEAGFFEADVRATLDEVSRSLTFGLDSIALRREREQAKRAQYEAYRRLRAIVDASTSAIWLTDRDGHCLLANESCAQWMQTTVARLLGQTGEQLLEPELARLLAARDRKVLETGQAISWEEYMPLPGGGRYVLAVRFPVRDADGDIYAIGGISTDISESRRAADQIRTLSDRWASLIAASPAAIFDLDAQGRVWSVWNHAAEELSGVSARDAIGQTPPMMHPSAQTAERLRQRALAGETVRGVEVTRRRLDGAVAHVNVSFAPLRDADGRVEGVLGVIIDVTDRVRATRALRESEARLRSLNMELEDRILERTRELMLAKERAETADRVKSVFLGTVSHELRTPLNSIIGFTDLILSGMAGPLTAEQRKQLGIVLAASRQLLALISDFLDISKIEAGAISLRIAPVHLPTDLRNEIAAFEGLAREHSIDLEVRSAAREIVVAADAQRVRQIMGNLVSNALKFTDAGRVTLTFEARQHDALVTVEDTGIGIPTEHLSTLFEPFKRIEIPGERDREGTGLGLAIARRLTEAMGGQIGVESSPRRGSRFWFTLPLATGGDMGNALPAGRG